MTTCLNYMHHIVELSKSRKKPKHLTTCRSQPMEYKGNKGGRRLRRRPPFFGFMLDLLTSAGV